MIIWRVKSVTEGIEYDDLKAILSLFEGQAKGETEDFHTLKVIAINAPSGKVEFEKYNPEEVESDGN